MAVVDAVGCGKSPGRIYNVDASRALVERGLFRSSTHQFGLAEAIALATQLNIRPARLVLYGIEGSEFNPGVGLSDPVIRSLPNLIGMIEEDLHLAHATSP